LSCSAQYGYIFLTEIKTSQASTIYVSIDFTVVQKLASSSVVSL